MTLQTAQAPTSLARIKQPTEASEQAWCLMLELVEEFGIAVSYKPFTQQSRQIGRNLNKWMMRFELSTLS
jgi:hypothetical protein